MAAATRARIPLGLLAALVLVAAPPAIAQSASPGRQQEIEQRGLSVMPFDINRTHHMFHLDGREAMLMVMSMDGDPAQIALIRAHLEKEAAAFAKGDFGDPAAIHGADMPGLAVLGAATGKLTVRYEEMPGGAAIHFSSDDPAVLGALKAWFAAQLADHGHHASMVMK